MKPWPQDILIHNLPPLQKGRKSELTGQLASLSQKNMEDRIFFIFFFDEKYLWQKPIGETKKFQGDVKLNLVILHSLLVGKCNDNLQFFGAFWYYFWHYYLYVGG